jgi:hypothetical protein
MKSNRTCTINTEKNRSSVYQHRWRWIEIVNVWKLSKYLMCKLLVGFVWLARLWWMLHSTQTLILFSQLLHNFTIFRSRSKTEIFACKFPYKLLCNPNRFISNCSRKNSNFSILTYSDCKINWKTDRKFTQRVLKNIFRILNNLSWVFGCWISESTLIIFNSHLFNFNSFSNWSFSFKLHVRKCISPLAMIKTE